jgi:hypothetical protein
LAAPSASLLCDWLAPLSSATELKLLLLLNQQLLMLLVVA